MFSDWRMNKYSYDGVNELDWLTVPIGRDCEQFEHTNTIMEKSSAPISLGGKPSEGYFNQR